MTDITKGDFWEFISNENIIYCTTINISEVSDKVPGIIQYLMEKKNFKTGYILSSQSIYDELCTDWYHTFTGRKDKKSGYIIYEALYGKNVNAVISIDAALHDNNEILLYTSRDSYIQSCNEDNSIIKYAKILLQDA